MDIGASPCPRGALDHGGERLQRSGIVVAATVDNDARRAVHPAAGAAHEMLHEMLADAGRVDAGGQLAGEAIYVEVQHGRVSHQVVELERVLMLVEHVVHRPERPLRPGGFRRLGRAQGMGPVLASERGTSWPTPVGAVLHMRKTHSPTSGG